MYSYFLRTSAFTGRRTCTVGGNRDWVDRTKSVYLSQLVRRTVQRLVQRVFLSLFHPRRPEKSK